MKLKVLVVIVDKGKTEKILSALIECGANYPHATLGTGTAPTALAEVLGLGDSEKGVVVCTVDEDGAKRVFECLKDKFEFCTKGTGIAFTVPMESVGGPATLCILAGRTEEVPK